MLPCAKNKLKQGEKVSAQRGKLIFTKWHDKRDISFLSRNVLPSKPSRLVARKKTGRNIHIEKPCVPDVYTADMGGVDRADQLRSFYFASYSSRKWYRYIFWFLFNLSVSNSFILEAMYRTNQGERKFPMINFSFQLAKQPINGISERKRKQRSQEALNQPVVRELNTFQFMSRVGRESVFNAYMPGEEHRKDTKLRLASSVVCANSHSVAHATMNTTLEHK